MFHCKYIPGWLIVILILFLTIIGPLSTDMYLPGLPEIAEYFGTSDAILNISLYGFLFAQAVAILFVGPLSDKYGRKGILIGSIVTYGISSILCGFTSNIWVFIALRLIQGMAVGGLIVISTALVKDCFKVESIGRVLSIITVLSVIGPMIAPILGAFLIQMVNWQSTLIFPGLLIVIPLIIAIFMNESLPKKEKLSESIISVIGHLPKLCKNRKFTYFLLAIGIWSFPFFAFLSVSSYIFEENFGLSQMMYSFVLAIDIIAATLLMLVIIKLGGKSRASLVGWIIIILGITSGIMMLTIGSLGALICLISFIPTATAAMAGRPYCLNILLRQYEGDTGSVSSLFNFVTIFLGCIGMFVVTFAWPSYLFGLTFCILVAGTGSLVLWLLFRKGGYGLKGME